MSRNTSDLIPEMEEKVNTLLERLSQQGYTLRPFFTLRGVENQAKLFRQSRATSEIEKAAEKLIAEGAPFLSKVLMMVGPQNGRWATNALPGQSWHQWGEATDCFVLNELGRAVWTAKHPGYKAYATEAKILGLHAGYFWQRKDAVHIQLRQDKVRSIYTWQQINKTMEERFG